MGRCETENLELREALEEVNEERLSLIQRLHAERTSKEHALQQLAALETVLASRSTPATGEGGDASDAGSDALALDVAQSSSSRRSGALRQALAATQVPVRSAPSTSHRVRGLAGRGTAGVAAAAAAMLQSLPPIAHERDRRRPVERRVPPSDTGLSAESQRLLEQAQRDARMAHRAMAMLSEAIKSTPLPLHLLKKKLRESRGPRTGSGSGSEEEDVPADAVQASELFLSLKIASVCQKIVTEELMSYKPPEQRNRAEKGVQAALAAPVGPEDGTPRLELASGRCKDDTLIRFSKGCLIMTLAEDMPVYLTFPQSWSSLAGRHVRKAHILALPTLKSGILQAGSLPPAHGRRPPNRISCRVQLLQAKAKQDAHGLREGASWANQPRMPGF